MQQDGLQIDTTTHPASTPSSTLLPGPHSNNAIKKLDLKCFTSFTTTLSPLILNTCHSQQKPEQATERTTYTATTTPTAGHSTDRCHSSPGPSPNGTNSANNIKTIEKVQRRAARRVTNRHHHTSCVNSIFNSLAWPTLQQRHKKARLEMFYKFHHHLVTIDSEYLPQPTETRTSHRKNNIHRYNNPYCRTQYRQMSFFPRTIPEWNSLP